MSQPLPSDITTTVAGGPLVEDTGAVPVPSRSLFVWSGAAFPAASLLVVGVLLGPRGLNLLTPRALAAIDPVVPVALAALGALVGLDSGAAWAGSRALVRAATASAAATAVVVAVALRWLAAATPTALVEPGLFPLVAGLAAATSLTLRRPPQTAQRQGDVFVGTETGVTILAAGLALVGYGPVAAAGAAAFAQALGIVALMAGAGWLLARHSTTATEGRVFAVAALLLVGGAADYLALSSLLGGGVAGLLWLALGGGAREALHQEMLRARAPLVVLVLLVAGARTDVVPLTIGLAIGYTALRLALRLATVAVLARWQPEADVSSSRLVAPGVFGVALALNVVAAFGADATWAATALSVVVLGTILSEALMRVTALNGARS